MSEATIHALLCNRACLNHCMRSVLAVALSVYSFLALFPLPGRADIGTNAVSLQLFYTEGCYKCGEVKQFMERLERQYAGRLRVERLDIADLSNYKRMMDYERRHGVRQSVPMEVFAAGRVFLGHESILHDLGPALANVFSALTAPPSNFATNLPAPCAQPSFCSPSPRLIPTATVLTRLRFWLVAGAGLIDGINPCAFATIVFLVSILASGRYTTAQITQAGLTFSAAVFLAYFLMGLGAMKALHRLDVFRTVADAVYWMVAVLAVVAGAFQARDAIAYARTGDADAIGVKVPETLRARIRVFLRERLRGRYLVAGCFAAGFVVSILEVVCTGQIYLPTIMVIIQDPSARGHGLAYLLLYNLMFITPLLVVMGLAIAGVAWQRVLGFSRRSIVAVKAALALLFFALAVFMAVSR